MEKERIRQNLADIIQILNNEMNREIPDDITLLFQGHLLVKLSDEIRNNK